MLRDEITSWLRESDPARLDALWRRADDVRRARVGDAVHLRGLVEASNHCARQCAYCGIRVENRAITRYRLTMEEIQECVRLGERLGYGTIVLQAGEDYGLTGSFIASVVEWIKSHTSMAVTLSLGERSSDELAAWRAAGADRYLLRFETSNRSLFEKLHPPRGNRACDRIALLRELRELGYEVGSGVMIGIPGQTWQDLTNDIELFRELDLDMIGLGPYLVHPETPLGRDAFPHAAEDDQVPADELTTYKALALARLVCPDANIPSTTALATVNTATGRENGLCRGANVIMPNLTPAKYRCLYEIYPGKACINETADMCARCVEGRIRAIGRTIGNGRGDSPNRTRREPRAASPASAS